MQVDYIISGPVVSMVWEGLNVIKIGRDMIGGCQWDLFELVLG